MGLQISYGGNPRAVDVDAAYSGMGHWGGGPGGAGGLQQNIENAFGVNEPIGYNPAMIAAGAGANAPGVNTGNEFTPTGGFNPFNSNPYNIDNITQPSTDIYGNPLSGFVSSNTGPELFGLQPGQFNPFNSNPYNIDNITQPSTFGGYPNQIGGYAYPGNLGYSVNPSGSMFGGQGWANQIGRDG